MSNKRLTERFPFLLPLRIKQRQYIYFKDLANDKNIYAKFRSDYLNEEVIEIKYPIINYESGFDIKYQYNKKHNLSLVKESLDGLLIKPNETFSFNLTTRYSDKEQKYKEGLVIKNNEMNTAIGGGLCQMSNNLYEAILNTPLTVIERVPHRTDYFKTDESKTLGLDATISSGWIDLKFKNETLDTYQLNIDIINDDLTIKILSNKKPRYKYKLRNDKVKYVKEDDSIFKQYSLIRDTFDVNTNDQVYSELISQDKIKIKYEIEEDIYE